MEMVLVVEKLGMMIPMMPGMMTMMMASISPLGKKFPGRNLPTGGVFLFVWFLPQRRRQTK